MLSILVSHPPQGRQGAVGGSEQKRMCVYSKKSGVWTRPLVRGTQAKRGHGLQSDLSHAWKISVDNLPAPHFLQTASERVQIRLDFAPFPTKILGFLKNLRSLLVP